MLVAELVVRLAQGYGVVGLLVCAAFLIVGIDRVDPGARGAYAFRILLAPGIVLLWPLVLLRWRALERARAGGA